jgi:regulation of enolase protein 1 (concanavalin A-like superfamily)
MAACTLRSAETGRQRDGEMLTLRTCEERDFWNNTFHGYKHVNGHFLAQSLVG